MSYQLWQHQEQMIQLALERKRVLWNVWMSGGKTLAGCDFIKRVGQPTLIVAPKAVLPTWANTLRMVGTLQDGTPITVYSFTELEGTVVEKTRQLPKTLSKGDVLIVNYDVVARTGLKEYLLLQPSLPVIICDESHRIKSHNAVTSKYIARLANTHRTEYRLCLTGTPTPNNPLDVFGQFRFLNERVLGKWWGAFRDEFAHTFSLPATNVKVVKGYHSLDKLATKIRPYTYELTLEKMMSDESMPDFPSVRHINVPVNLPHRLIDAITRLERDFIAEIDEGTLTADNVLVKMLRLSMLSSGYVVPATDETPEPVGKQIDTTKLDACLDFISDIDPSEPIVIFCRFRHEIEYLRDKLGALELSGKANDLARWQGGANRILIVQIQSGAEGVDLTRARVAIFFSNTYDLGKYQQAVARLQRANSEHDKVVYYHFIAQGTIDEALYKALASKDKVNQQLYDYLRRI